ncbi:MAG: hypothetical protein AB4368_04115 [Xenococcaceae cyanobacterium]
MVKIAHIINPVKIKKHSDLFVAQPITFQTMQTAQKLAQQQGITVELYSAQFPEDRGIVPDYFQKTPDLTRSILDIKSFRNSRKLPLIKDILDNLYNSTNADYLIYTNVDIAVMPHFYLSVAEIINQGYDAFIVNRRTIGSYDQIEKIPLMYSKIGGSHAGYDCFIFSRDAYPKYVLNNTFIGSVPIGFALAANLICNAQNFKLFTALHLTFHLGSDGAWKQKGLEDYLEFNIAETDKIYQYYLNNKTFKNHQITGRYLRLFSNINSNESRLTLFNKLQLSRNWLAMEIYYKLDGLSERIVDFGKKLKSDIN